MQYVVPRSGYRCSVMYRLVCVCVNSGGLSSRWRGRILGSAGRQILGGRRRSQPSACWFRFLPCGRGISRPGAVCAAQLYSTGKSTVPPLTITSKTHPASRKNMAMTSVTNSRTINWINFQSPSAGHNNSNVARHGKHTMLSLSST